MDKPVNIIVIVVSLIFFSMSLSEICTEYGCYHIYNQAILFNANPSNKDKQIGINASMSVFKWTRIGCIS